jgi:AraC family transcriptional regulator
MEPAADDQSEEFYPFLRGSSTLGFSSRELGWKGLLVEQRSAGSGERPEAIAEHYILALVCGRPWTGEHPNGRGRFVSTANVPGMITLISPGIVPAIRTKEGCEHILCALETSFVKGVENELDRRPAGSPWSRGGLEDPAIRQLMKLLAAEATQGGPSGRLYADHLGHALAVRLLLLSTAAERQASSMTSPLPRPTLRRILERMENLGADLDLASLAAESGYSRGHFIRMFRAATGLTPHHYVLQARLKRAQQMIKSGSLSFIDIAETCGFSSHAHMTRTFRQLLHVTPSEYRRNL